MARPYSTPLSENEVGYDLMAGIDCLEFLLVAMNDGYDPSHQTVVSLITAATTLLRRDLDRIFGSVHN